MSEPSDMDFGGRGSPPKGYALSGKIMLSAIVILFAVVVFVLCLHVYARWYLLRVRRRQLRRRRRSNFVIYVDPNNPNATAVAAAHSGGLDASVLNSLPVFVYSSKTQPDLPECAVCLSEFEENEKGRVLPKCNHSFHIECIDMWFHSHSTCPLCRSPVELQTSTPVADNRSEIVISVSSPIEPGPSSGLCSECLHNDEQMPAASSSSIGTRRKGLDLVGVTIEVPRRNESDDELGIYSPASQGFKSPGSRLLSLKRILSMNRRGAATSPSSGVGPSCGSAVAEMDVERGIDESAEPNRAKPSR